MSTKISDRDNHFQHMVLHGLYCCVWLLCRLINKQGGVLSGWYGPAVTFRSSCLSFGDQHGNQAESAKEYRREHTYPSLPS